MWVEFSFFQSVKRLEISSFISILLTPKIAVQINHYCNSNKIFGVVITQMINPR